MNTVHENNARKGSPWLRLGLLTFTLAGPVINAVGEQIRQRSQILREQAKTLQGSAQTIQVTARQRLDQLAQESRKQIVEQAKQLHQLRSQARPLRRAIRKNVKRRRKLVKKLSWLQPPRKRNRNFWALVGFGIGLVAAGITTYLFVRRRVVQQSTEESQSSELPQSGSWNGLIDASQGHSEGRPAGEILLLDDIGTVVATLPVVDVEQIERPADAVFVGVASTRFYYPVETSLEELDLIYFASEEEAVAQGFTAAQ